MAIPPQAVIIAGPNGSGKSTAATQLLPPEMTFINADMIAQAISGKPGAAADINAGRLLLGQLETLEANREDFAFETTLATKMLASRVRGWRANGYRVHVIFMFLPNADLAVERVAARVRAGGHEVPEATVRRRFVAGLRNFFRIYRPFVDTWRVYDNSTQVPWLIARGSTADEDRVVQAESWSNLIREFGE